LQSIAGRRAQEPVQNASEGLQTMLEGIADHRLAPPQLSGSAIRIKSLQRSSDRRKNGSKGCLSPTGESPCPHRKASRRSGC
jgi:hypothetical protein